MKKNFLKVLSLVLCAAMLVSCFAFSVSADEAATGAEPTRVSVVFNGDASTQRGITWYTNEKTNSVVQIMGLDGKLIETAKITYEEVFEWEGKFVHKALVSDLTPGTIYLYRVGDGVNFSEIGTFVTDNGDSKTDYSEKILFHYKFSFQ